MNKLDWQRLKNLSLYKLWVTDKELSRLAPLAILIAIVFLIATAVRWLHH